ncbi:conserved hypothetical protein [Neospora caninum Liverpool]|uniref:SET domain-containing protein n=1 Tax=Neospora caninum (strain Liverpool) TaxID=572307 RepID=F0VE51_NEOCL|nr:conserved hypothetical protein [Neospora caninum Liverpool]CBZ51994.1 conserved hypothetical protein [Neospora caninum Liverpool]|eukprot:XP_003882027.1 conserved hypothetical protein [Neospora caninum Liverpool]
MSDTETPRGPRTSGEQTGVSGKPHRVSLPPDSAGREKGRCSSDSWGHREPTETETENADSPFSAVEIAFVNSKVGRGVLARRAFKKGEVIYNDAEPLVAAQHIYSERCSWTCGRCFTFVGNLRQQLELILSNDASDAAKRDRRIQENLELLTDDFLQEDFCLAQPVPCARNCGVVYCSEEHKKVGRRENALRKMHMHFSSSGGENAGRRERMANRSGGRAYAQMLVDVLYGQASVEDVMTPFCRFYSRRWEDIGDAEEALSAPRGAAERWRRSRGRLEILKESFSLLCRVFLAEDVLGETPWATENGDEPDTAHLRDKWKVLFSLDFYSHLLGTFDLVNVDIEFDNPLNARLASSRLSSLWRCKPLFRLGKRIAACEDAEDDEDQEIQGGRSPTDGSEAAGAEEEEWKALVGDLLPPFMGIGLFRAVSMTNHSCWPNAEVDYPSLTKTAQVTALRDIAQDEQVLLSYIDETLPLASRQRLLKRHYKFTCACVRCQVEAAAALLDRRGALPAAEGAAVDAIADATGLSPLLVGDILSFSASFSKSSGEAHAPETVSEDPSLSCGDEASEGDSVPASE